MSRIRVLVSNDDGILAPGIVALVSALGTSDLCDVFVSAPGQERSASSHAITLGQRISAIPHAMHGKSSNTPAAFAVKKLQLFRFTPQCVDAESS